MTAGTVVITGGILATVILLFIIAVLCYCRLQYYCCKKNGSDCGSISQPHFLCQACHAPSGLEGPCVQPWSLSPEPPEGVHVLCPSCPSYDSPFSLRTLPEMPNGSERVTYVPTHYENQALVLPLPAGHGSLLREGRAHGPQQPDFYTNTRAISTEV